MLREKEIEEMICQMALHACVDDESLEATNVNCDFRWRDSVHIVIYFGVSDVTENLIESRVHAEKKVNVSRGHVYPPLHSRLNDNVESTRSLFRGQSVFCESSAKIGFRSGTFGTRY